MIAYRNNLTSLLTYLLFLTYYCYC